MPRINPIRIPSPSIREIPRPVIRSVPPAVNPPVIRGISPPVINVPDEQIIDYPTIEIPTQPVNPQVASPTLELDPALTQEEDTRDLRDEPQEETPTTPSPEVTIEQPTINLGGVEAPLPEAAPLVTAGATAVVTTSVALVSTILLNKLKDTVIEPAMKRMSSRKKKIKIKQTKPVLHFVLDDDGGVDIYEYSVKGTKLVDTTEDVERYLRDQVELDSLYEYDNKIIIDDVIKERFTKEGAKRFKSLFAPAKSVAKKLAAKFSF